MKRLVVGLSVSVLSMFVVAPAATAAPSSSASESAKVVKAKKVKKDVFTDQVIVKTPGGGVSTLRIDWD